MNRHVITLKWGNCYGAGHVNRLANAVKRHTRNPVSIVCFTDDASGIDPSVKVLPLPEIGVSPVAGAWGELGLFHPALPMDGLGLFLGLDTVITGGLDDFFTWGQQEDLVIAEIDGPDASTVVGGHAVWRFKLNQCGQILEQFLGEQEWAMANFRDPHAYLKHRHGGRIKSWPSPWVRDFGQHCRPVFPLNLWLEPRLPRDARVIVFRGKPDPDEAAAGYKGRDVCEHSRAAGWIAPNWRAKLLVTGCGRSGTHFTAALLRHMGLDMPHEEVGRDGAVSWKHIAAGTFVYLWKKPRQAEIDADGFTCILHQVRHPLKVIASMQTFGASTWHYMAKFIDLDTNAPALYKAMQAWVGWNGLIESKASWRFRIEDLQANFTMFCEKAGLPKQEMPQLPHAAKDSRTERYQTVGWEDLVAIDAALAEQVRQMALRYGYEDLAAVQSLPATAESPSQPA